MTKDLNSNRLGVIDALSVGTDTHTDRTLDIAIIRLNQPQADSVTNNFKNLVRCELSQVA